MAGLPNFVAFRYLISRNTVSIITIMSFICMLVVAMVTMAMVVVLSAFNGIEELIDQRYSYFDADLTILPATGKTMEVANFPYGKLEKISGLKSYANVIEENVLAEYEGNQRIVKIKGVEDNFVQTHGLDSMMVEGGAGLYLEDRTPAALMGVGVRHDLNLRLFEQSYHPLALAALVRGKKLSKNRENALHRKLIPVSGIFSINVDFDSEYVIVPLSFASDLLKYHNEITAVEVNLNTSGDKAIAEAQEQLRNELGENYKVSSRFDKNALIYQTNRSEKWATFMILGFIMLIATFNIIAALTMLINEKRQDIKILSSLGAPAAMIRRIFFTEGLLINAFGAAVGLTLGFLLVVLQNSVGLIRLQGGLVEYYPMTIQWSDFFAVFALVVCCGLISSIVPVRIFTRRFTT